MNQKDVLNLAECAPKTQKVIDQMIGDLCEEHKSEALEQDIVAMFEDIIRFFSGREEEFINLDAMSAEQKKTLYAEIRILIEYFKKMRGSQDKQEVINIISKGLIYSLHKNTVHKSVQEAFTAADQKRIKEMIARAALNEFHQKRLKASQVSKQHSLEKQLEQIKGSFAKHIVSSRSEEAVLAVSKKDLSVGGRSL